MLLDEDRSEGRHHSGCNQRGQNGGLEKAGHVVDSLVGIRECNGGGEENRGDIVQTRRGFIVIITR